MLTANVKEGIFMILFSELGLNCIAVNIQFFIALLLFYFQVGLYVKRGCLKGSIEIEL